MINIGCRSQISEYAKLVINMCVDSYVSLSNIKLQKLLIIMQGVACASYGQALFQENISKTSYGLAYKEVNRDFLADFDFDEKYLTYITPLDREKKVMNEVLRTYGQLDEFTLNKLPVMQKLYVLLKNYDFNAPSDVEKCILESVFIDNLVVKQINLDKDNTLLN